MTYLASTDLLEFVLPTNIFIDAIRVLLAGLGFITFVFATIRWLQHVCFWQSIAFMAGGMLTFMQQVEALNEPMHPWRVPLFALLNAAALVVIYQDQGHDCDV